MYNPHFQNFYHQHNDRLANTYPRSHNVGQNAPQNRFRKPLTQNFSEEHWCETCDRGFPSFDLLEKHKQQHQKCNIDGCQFIAHPKVITKHIQMQHSSGLYSKIAKLNNPEEIKKWLEERKRKYPTKINIEKKTAEVKEKIERGEKMGLSHERKKPFNKQANGANKLPHTTGRNHHRGERPKPYPSPSTLTKKSTVPKKVHQVLPNAESLRVLKPFAGIQDIVMKDTPEDTVDETACDFIIDDDDLEKKPTLESEPQNLLNNIEPKVCGALSSLMCNYESSEEEIGDTEELKPAQHLKTKETSVDNKKDNDIVKQDKLATNTIIKSNVPIKDSDNKSDDDSGPEEQKIDKIKEPNTLEEEPKVVKTKIKQATVEKNHNRRKFMKPKQKIPSTLLQKLLKREVQQERNIILQCIRHVVKNNFFDDQK